MMGKIESRRRGQQKARSLDSITDSMNMSLHKLQVIEKEREDLAYYIPWDRKELDMTERVNNTAATIDTLVSFNR